MALLARPVNGEWIHHLQQTNDGIVLVKGNVALSNLGVQLLGKCIPFTNRNDRKEIVSVSTVEFNFFQQQQSSVQVMEQGNHHSHVFQLYTDPNHITKPAVWCIYRYEAKEDMLHYPLCKLCSLLDNYPSDKWYVRIIGQLQFLPLDPIKKLCYIESNTIECLHPALTDQELQARLEISKMQILIHEQHQLQLPLHASSQQTFEQVMKATDPSSIHRNRQLEDSVLSHIKDKDAKRIYTTIKRFEEQYAPEGMSLDNITKHLEEPKIQKDKLCELILELCMMGSLWSMDDNVTFFSSS